MNFVAMFRDLAPIVGTILLTILPFTWKRFKKSCKLSWKILIIFGAWMWTVFSQSYLFEFVVVLTHIFDAELLIVARDNLRENSYTWLFIMQMIGTLFVIVGLSKCKWFAEEFKEERKAAALEKQQHKQEAREKRQAAVTEKQQKADQTINILD